MSDPTKDPEDLSDDELLERIAKKDRSKYKTPEWAAAALDQEGSS